MCPDTFIVYFSCMSVCQLKLKLNSVARGRCRRLGLPPIARGRSMVTDRITGPARGRSSYPEGCEAARA